MLKKLVKENKDRAVEKNGACRFCGQIKLVEALEEFNEDELNELATEQCNCYEAQNYISRLYRKEKADFRIEELFGSGNKPELTDARMQMLHQAAGYVVDGIAEKVTVEVTGELKMMVSETAKGNIKINRKTTVQRAAEVQTSKINLHIHEGTYKSVIAGAWKPHKHRMRSVFGRGTKTTHIHHAPGEGESDGKTDN